MGPAVLSPFHPKSLAGSAVVLAVPHAAARNTAVPSTISVLVLRIRASCIGSLHLLVIVGHRSVCSSPITVLVACDTRGFPRDEPTVGGLRTGPGTPRDWAHSRSGRHGWPELSRNIPRTGHPLAASGHRRPPALSRTPSGRSGRRPRR